jgi:hypothetical protein
MAKAKAGLRERAEVLPKWRLDWTDRLSQERPGLLEEISRGFDEFNAGDPYWRARFKGLQGFAEWVVSEYSLNVGPEQLTKWYRVKSRAKQ